METLGSKCEVLLFRIEVYDEGYQSFAGWWSACSNGGGSGSVVCCAGENA